ncbi:MAG: molybdopterin-dependent oxidoreductase [Sandaracinus sp.]|nr:molybdopterin-dependent oxidoreductase [Sandaracinus sp.]
MTDVRTTCAYCGVGCGIVARREGSLVEVVGDPQHPSNHGRLCSKGASLAETVGLEGRLLHPEIDGRRTSWDEALTRVAHGFAEVLARRGPEAVAFYLSGQLLTEDYYVANKLAKAGLGTANVDTNSRLCMASTVAGHSLAFGADVVPQSYEDLDEARLTVFVGSNAAWCHPILYQRTARARKADPTRKIVVIDPRRTATAAEADLHLPIRPGTDVLLFQGLLAYLVDHGALDFAFLESHVRGAGEAIAAAREAGGLARVALECGLREEDVRSFYDAFLREPKTVTVFSQGVNQSTRGTDKVSAILAVHLATGRIGKPGCGPFSFTGQPNAMGGREVGGLASTLAAHMGFSPENVDRVARFWGSDRVPSKPGRKAVDLFEAMRRGEIEAVWILCTNPLVSLPESERVREALERCPLVVVSDCEADTDTARYAHVRLPALTWGEKDGTVTSSERRISRQRAFLPRPGVARADWEALAEVGRRMGRSGFDYDGPAAIFREHAALTAFENDGTRPLDLGALASLDDAAYDALAPVQWPVPKERPEGTPRLFADGGFATDDGRAHMRAVRAAGPARAPNREHPLVLNTGRVRDHWHTMTRTARSPRLSAHRDEPYAELHPSDAEAAGVRDGGLVRVESRHGGLIAKARVTRDQRRGSVFVPMHWTAITSSHGRVNAAVSPEVDAISGQPESKHTPVRVTPWEPTWRGFLLRRENLDVSSFATWWVRITGRGHVAWELAGDALPDDWRGFATRALGVDAQTPLLEYRDAGAGRFRAAHVDGDALHACLFVESSVPGRASVGREWAASAFENALDDQLRFALLAGRPPSGAAKLGPTICSCHGVCREPLLLAIRTKGLRSVEELGLHTRAGTGCGSCVAELRGLLEETSASGASRRGARS